jgi:hypothetical protein
MRDTNCLSIRGAHSRDISERGRASKVDFGLDHILAAGHLHCLQNPAPS